MSVDLLRLVEHSETIEEAIRLNKVRELYEFRRWSQLRISVT